MLDAKTPTTFEEWSRVSPTGNRTRAAWDAGIASQQGLIENLRYHRSVDAAALADALGERDSLRKVVRKVIELDDHVGIVAHVIGSWDMQDAIGDEIQAAFDELRSLVNVVRNEVGK